MERDDLPGDKWRMRQTGIHHVHTRSDALTDLWLIFHPQPDSVFAEKLLRLPSDPSSASMLRGNPLRIQEMLLSSYMDNWRWYMKYQADRLTREACDPALARKRG